MDKHFVKLILWFLFFSSCFSQNENYETSKSCRSPFSQGSPVYQRIKIASRWSWGQLQIKAPRFMCLYLCVYISAGCPCSLYSWWDHAESNSAQPRTDLANAQPNTHCSNCIEYIGCADTQVICGYPHTGAFFWAASHLWFTLHGVWLGESMFNFNSSVYFKLNMGLGDQLLNFSADLRLTQIIWQIYCLALETLCTSSPAFTQLPPTESRDPAKGHLSCRNKNKCLFIIYVDIRGGFIWSSLYHTKDLCL